MIQNRYQSIVDFNFNDIKIRKIWMSIRIILIYKNPIHYTYFRISNSSFNSNLRIIKKKKKQQSRYVTRNLAVRIVHLICLHPK